MRGLRSCGLGVLLCLSAVAVANAASPEGNQTSRATDLPVFKSNVNLVLVPVVVRDSRGNAVGNLRRENFRILDNGKPQVIKQFSIENAATPATSRTDAVITREAATPVAAAATRRFVAYLFDDLHLGAGDLPQARDAAERHLAALHSGENVALYTTSGRQTVDFTDDTAKVRAALRQIVAWPKVTAISCPDLGPLWAAQIDEAGYIESVPEVATALRELSKCPGYEGLPLQILLTILQSKVQQTVGESQQEAQKSVALLRDVAARMSVLPGERAVVTVSEGFLFRRQSRELAEVIERAIQARVVVNALDARGLYTPAWFDARQRAPVDPAIVRTRMEEASLQQDVLAELAHGTGGVFFHNSNDLNEGFRQTAGTAEYTYMIGFAPEPDKDPKADPFHKLTVKLEDAGHDLTIQARRGYMANAESLEPAQAGIQQIHTALYSREEMAEIPMKVSTQVSDSGGGDPSLRVTVRLSLKNLPLSKLDGRYGDDLEIQAGIFNRKGKYVTSKGNRLKLRFKEQTVAQVNAGAATLPEQKLDLDFELKPGDYNLRVVVRAAESQLMAAANSTVKIQ